MAYREHYATHVASEVTTTSSSIWTNAATLNFTPVSGRDYVLLWSLELANKTDTSTDARYRVSIDGAAVTTSNIESRATGEYAAFFGFFKVTGTGVTRSVAVDVQVEQAGQTGAIRNIRLTALALGADDHYAESLGRTDVNVGGASWADLAAITWTPASDGDYLLLSSSLVDNFAATAPAYGRFNVGWASPEWPTAVAEVASGQMNYAAGGGVWVEGFAGGLPVTLKWQGRSLNNGTNSGWTDNRVLALRLDAFDHYAAAALSSDSSAAAVASSAVLTLSDTVSVNPQLVIGAWVTASPTSAVLGQVQVSDGLGLIANSQRRTFAAADSRGAVSGVYALRQGYTPGAQSWSLTRASDGANSYTVRGGATLVVLDLGAVGRKLTAASGAFGLTSGIAAPRSARRLVGAVRSCSLAGTSAPIRRGFRLRGDLRGYEAIGLAARRARGLKLRVSVGALFPIGGAVTLIRTVAGRRLSAATTAIGLGQRSAGARFSRRLPATADGLTWSRLDARLHWTRRVVAETVGFAATGRSIGWWWTHNLKAASTGLGTSSPAASLRYSGEHRWRPVDGAPETWTSEGSEPARWSAVCGAPEVWS